ncbi:MAG: hypothetical protein KBT48_06755 [Firmicutes bacterium]|nr:hypothetical protein [Bacillota bacterium]
MKGFTWKLALLDACPVLLFGISVLSIGAKFNNPFFRIGAILSFLAGLGKVVWKILLAWKQKDVRILSNQFKYCMISGAMIMFISTIMAKVNWLSLFQAMCTMPSVIFFGIGIIGMALMGYMAKNCSQEDAKNNWIEEVINTLAQLCILLGILFI